MVAASMLLGSDCPGRTQGAATGQDAASIQDYVVGQPTAIHYSGDPKTRFNIVILGDGFTQSALPAYRTIVDDLKDELLATHPFGALSDAFNIYRIDIRSDQLGTTYPQNCAVPGTPQGVRSADTPFQIRYGGESGTRCDMLASDAKAMILDAAALIPGYDDYVLVLVNDWYPAGAGYYGDYIAYASISSLDAGVTFVSGDDPTLWAQGTDSSQWQINSDAWRGEIRSMMIHEFAHAAFNLADEYGGQQIGTVSYASDDPQRPNVTMAGSLAGLKWSDLVVPVTPVPTERPAACCAACSGTLFTGPSDLVGLFEGANRKDCLIYRPQADCRMKTTWEGRPFCAVCRRKIVHTLAGYLKPGFRRGLLLPAGPNRAYILLDTLTTKQTARGVFVEYEMSAAGGPIVTGVWPPAPGTVTFISDEPQRIETLAAALSLSALHRPRGPVKLRIRILRPGSSGVQVVLDEMTHIPLPDPSYPITDATYVVDTPHLRLTASIALYIE